MRGERRRPTPHLGDRLHPRNRYRDNKPDFYALGLKYPQFKQVLVNIDHDNKTATMPFDDPAAVLELTRTLLKADFGLDWTMPVDRLCPPLPNRLNYIHWIEDLLHSNNINPFQPSPGDVTTRIRGIDIGTGASCIYALLGAKMNKWSFLATEIDETSFESARANVSRNAMDDEVHVIRVATISLLKEPLARAPDDFQSQPIHFSMCNPPFFSDMSEADTNPDSACMGSASEMVCPGGEVAFIGHMIDDSLELQDRVLLYTSMIGRKSSLRQLLAVLRSKNIHNVCSIEFFQGRTKRWGVAWSFSDKIELRHEAKVLGKRKESHRQHELTFRIPMWTTEDDHGCRSIDEVASRMEEFAQSQLDYDCRLSRDTTSFTLLCKPSTKEDVANNNIGFHAAIQLQENSDMRSYEVTIAYESGNREECWRVCEGLKSATIRSGRRWRRRRVASTVTSE